MTKTHHLQTTSLLLICLLCMISLAGAKTVRVGIYENPPLVFQKDADQPEGLFIDVLESVAQSAGWTIDYEMMTFRDCLVALEDNTVDLVPAVAATYDRRKKIDFTRSAVIENWAVVYQNENVVLNNLFDLEGKTILAIPDDVHRLALEDVLKRYRISATISDAEDYSEAMERLDMGQADAAVVNRTFSTRRGGRFNSISTLLMFNPQPLYFAFPKRTGPDLIHTLDLAIDRQRNDPYSPLNQSFATWLKPESQTVVPIWIYWLGAGFLFLVVGVSIFSQTLQRLVRTRTEELLEEKERSEHALRSQNLFLATLSHELRTPLNYLTGSVGLLKEDFKHSPSNLELIDDIEHGINRLERLFISLLSFAHVENDAVERSIGAVNLSQLFEEIFDVAQHMPKAQEVQLEKRLDIPTELVVIADEDALFQITLNLLHNALKYTQQGSVVLSVSVKTAAETEQQIYIEISDTGVGFDPHEIDSIMLPFKRGTKDNFVGNGAGLGLSIVARLVERIHGVLQIESKPGEGSRFTLELSAPLG